jgi:tRNA (cmo5U34)-methyltransferase
MTVKRVFDAGAEAYDGQRRKVIPCFDDFYGTAVDLIPFDPSERFTVLDLGAGTGLLTALILKRFPRAEPTVLDFSEKMLEKARERFQRQGQVRFVALNYADSPLPGDFHLVVSAMSIHHLFDSEKRRLFNRIYNALSAGGYFIHAELVRGTTDFSEAVYRRVWLDHLKETDLAEHERSAILDRMTYDRTAALEAQLSWLREAGFVDIDCYYKYHPFAVYAGRKLGG